MKVDPRSLAIAGVDARLASVERRLDALAFHGRFTIKTLFRVLLLQRWLEMDVDAVLSELEDRVSLRQFCGLAVDAGCPSVSEVVDFRAELQRLGGGPLLDEAWEVIQPTPLVTIVSPVFQAQEIVDELVQQVSDAVVTVTDRFEIILIDDGSRDLGWERILAVCARDSRVKGVRLSRNFGQHFAITAGLDLAAGEWVVVMDCDLQDDPKYIPALLARARQGFDVVYTVKARRRHSSVRNVLGQAFALALNWLSGGTQADARIGAYSVLSRRAVEAFRKLRESQRHYLRVVSWLGFPSTQVEIEHRPRFRGRSSYSFGALLRHAIVGITAQSDRLLYGALVLGALFFATSLAAAALLVFFYFLHGFREGWTSTIVLTLLSTSAVLFCIGVVGVYVSKIYEQVKDRPLYLTRDKVNF